MTAPGESIQGAGADVFIADFGKVTRVPFQEWFTLDVIADGDAIAILVNGKTSGRHVNRRRDRFSSGHVALQQYSPETVIEFRKIEMKELNRLNQKDPREIACLPNTAGRVSEVVFSPDGRRILSGVSPAEYTRRTGGGNFFHQGPYTVRSWEAGNGANLFNMRGEEGAIGDLALSSDGRSFASSPRKIVTKERGCGASDLIWDAKTGERVHRLYAKMRTSNYTVRPCHFRRTGIRVMAALKNGTVLVWDVATEQEQSPIALKAGPIKQDEFPVATFISDQWRSGHRAENRAG